MCDVRRTRAGQRRLTRILTRIESEIFLKRAVPRLAELGVPCLPIHDCVMVPEQHFELANREIVKAAAEVLGFIPVVKVTVNNLTLVGLSSS